MRLDGLLKEASRDLRQSLLKGFTSMFDALQTLVDERNTLLTTPFVIG
jgi:hypothetical protein